MDRSQIPLNALRAFEASARHLSFTRAGLELHVSQAAISHQVKGLEERLGVVLFRRLPRGLALTDEGAALVPVLGESLDRIGSALDRYAGGRFHEVLTIGVVSSFAVRWLLPRLDGFRTQHPHINIRILTNNNRVDLAGEGLDYAIRFGDGAWHGTEAELLFPAPLTLMATADIANRLTQSGELAEETLLRSYRADEWPRWFAAAGLQPPHSHGPVFDSSIALAGAAEAGLGIALLPQALFADSALVRPFPIEIETGSYWLTRLKTREPGGSMAVFRDWLAAEALAFASKLS